MTLKFLSVPCPVSELEPVKSEVKGWKPLSANPVGEVNGCEPKPPRQVTLNHRVGGSSPSRRTLLSGNTYFNRRGIPQGLCASAR